MTIAGWLNSVMANAGSLNTIGHGVLLVIVMLVGWTAADECVVLRNASLSAESMRNGMQAKRTLTLKAVRHLWWSL